MTLRIVILLGGFMPGPDGWLTSAGMHLLRGELATKFSGADISEFQWSNYAGAAAKIANIPAEDKAIVIGYSGGGSRATWMVRERPHLRVDLMVLYDPSPSWQVKPIKSTAVKKCVVYHNRNPFFFGLGGGVVLGDPGQVETIDISENHVLVQSDQNLHALTIKKIAVT